jgi:hypothetical protein
MKRKPCKLFEFSMLRGRTVQTRGWSGPVDGPHRAFFGAWAFSRKSESYTNSHGVHRPAPSAGSLWPEGRAPFPARI